MAAGRGTPAAMAPRALCAVSPSPLAQIRLETPQGGVCTPVPGSLPQKRCFSQRGAAHTLPLRGGPLFLPQHRPRFPEERRALRAACLPSPSPASRSARGAVPWREPRSSLPTAPSRGFPAEHGAEFPRREDGETPREPPGRGRGTPRCPSPQFRLALPAAHLRAPRRHRSVLRRQRPALFQTSAFPGSGAAPPAPSRGVRVWEVLAGVSREAEILLPPRATVGRELNPPPPP